MKKLSKSYGYCGRFLIRSGLLLVVAIFLLGTGIVCAQGIDADRWVPLDLFEQKTKRFAPPLSSEEAQSKLLDEIQKEAESARLKENEDFSEDAFLNEKKKNLFSTRFVPLALGQKKLVKTSKPNRLLRLPNLPAARVDYNVFISSTEEEKESPYEVNKKESPKFSLRDDGWRHIGESQKDDGSLESKTALAVRFAFLPNPKVTPVERSVVFKRPSFEDKKEKKEERPLGPVCDSDAVNAVRREKQRALDAIESDRETLRALKQAIEELGVEDKINFISGASQPMMSLPKE